MRNLRYSHELFLSQISLISQITIKTKTFLVDENTGKSIKYHSSWDWLMPVVEEIETTDKYFKYRLPIKGK